MVGAVKVKCIRIWSEGWSPYIKTYREVHMRKSVKRFYEIDRSYDYGDACGFKNTKQNVGFVKHRSHKRLRQQLKKFI